MHNRVKNQRPVSSLYVDATKKSNALVEKLKEILPFIISQNENASIKIRCISESSRLITDIIDICDKNKILGYMLTMDIEKRFDSLDHDFLIYVLEKFVYGDNFIKCVKVLRTNQ